MPMEPGESLDILTRPKARGAGKLADMDEISEPITADRSRWGPVAPHARVNILDMLRGWAIFGILLMDIEGLYRPEADWSVSDQSVYQFLGLFGDAKFWTLLSFLFGVGFSIQLIRGEGQVGFIARYRRRLVALILIGVAQHFLLMWGGHFLIRYGAMGFLLFALRGLPSRALVPAAVTFMLIPWAYSAAIDFNHTRRLANPATRAEVLQIDAERRAAATAVGREWREARRGGYPRRLAVQAKVLHRTYILPVYDAFYGRFVDPPVSYVSWLSQLGLFLVGLRVGRRRILQDISPHLPLIRRVLIVGLAFGFAVAAVRFRVPNAANQDFAVRHGLSMLKIFGDPALAFAYGAAIVLLAQRRFWQRLFAPLAAAGRMALTNYLLMALLVGVLTPYFGFGVFERIGPSLGPPLAAAIYATLMLLSTWWLKHFRFGPAEWLWRTLTYRTLQPMSAQPSLVTIP